jgi:hypothetical protein
MAPSDRTDHQVKNRRTVGAGVTMIFFEPLVSGTLVTSFWRMSGVETPMWTAIIASGPVAKINPGY